jgi:hypothetical protein
MQYPSPTSIPEAALPLHSRAPQATSREAQQAVGDLRDNLSADADTAVRRGVAETSIEAFHSLSPIAFLAPKEAAILRLFKPGVKLSRQQVSAMVPMPINGVCGRVDSLLAAKHLEECGDRIDPQTRKRQKLLQLPEPAQQSLEGLA